MKPYSHLDIPPGIIKHRLRQYVQRSGLIQRGKFVNDIGLEGAYEAIPELKDLLQQHGLSDLVTMLIIRTQPSSIARNYPHTDVMLSPDMKVAVNWPIFNCDETFTTFYEAKPGVVPVLSQLSNGLPYNKYQYEDVIETHRMTLNVPTAIRYDVLHAIVNDTPNIRMTASFRFESNHWELFKD